MIAEFAQSPALRAAAYALAILATLLVGWIDYITGTEVRLLALYFLPLVYAGWRLGMRAAVATAVFACAVWIVSAYASGVRRSRGGHQRQSRCVGCGNVDRMRMR